MQYILHCNIARYVNLIKLCAFLIISLCVAISFLGADKIIAGA